MRMRRVVRWGLGVIAVVVVIALGSATWLLRSAHGHDIVRGFIERQAANALDGTLHIGSIDGALLRGIGLNDLRFEHAGREVISVPRAEVGYNLWGLMRGGRSLAKIRLIRPVIRIAESRNTWDAGQWMKPSKPSTGPSLPFELPSVEIVDGRLLATARESVWRLPAEIRALNADLRIKVGGGPAVVTIEQLSFQSVADATGTLTARSATGAIVFDKDTVLRRLRLTTDGGSLTVDGRVGGASPHTLDVAATLEQFNTTKWRPLSPLLDTLDLTADGTAAIGGNTDRVTVKTALRTSAGALDGDTVIASSSKEVRITGDLRLSNFNARYATADPSWESAFTGHTRFTVVGTGTPAVWAADVTHEGGPVRAFGGAADALNGTLKYVNGLVTFDTAAKAYGATARARGTIHTADPFTVDVTGEDLQGLDPRALPVEWGFMRLDASLAAAAFTAHWTEGNWTVNATLNESQMEGATLAAGMRLDLASSPTGVTVTADGNVRTLDARRWGKATGITGLDDPIFVTDLNGHVSMSGRGRDWSDIDMQGRAELVNSRAAAGASVPSASVVYRRQAHANTAHVVGLVIGLNPATLGSSEALASTINGHLDFTADWRDDVDDVAGSVVARGALEATPSVLAKLPIDRASVNGEWRDGMFTAQKAEFEGNGLVFSARGRMAITAGTSRATFELSASDVIALEPWSGEPAHGAASGSGELTGPFDVPRVAATFQSPRMTEAGLGTFDMIAGRLDADFADWDTARMRGDLSATAETWTSETGTVAHKVKGQGTFATQTRVTASTVEADVNDVHVRAAMAADWTTDTNVTINAFDATRAGHTWRLDSSAGSLRVNNSHLTANNVVFASGTQRIALVGSVALSELEAGGHADDRLSMHATGIDLAALDAFLGTSFGGQGVVAADATLTGRLSDPRGRIVIDANNFNVRGYQVTAAGGTIDLANGAAVVDLTVRQPDGLALKVVGKGPLDWLLPDGSLDAAVPKPNWDLTAVSDPINIAILGGMAPRLSDLGGQAMVNLHIIGASRSPSVTGTVAVTDGKFGVPSLGTSYSRVGVDIDLGVDIVSVKRFIAYDSHGHPLKLSGQLAVSERQVNRVDVNVEADQVEIVNNGIGSIELSSLLQLSGDVAHPKLTGNIEVAQGRVEVDRLLRALQGDPLAFVAEADLPAEGVTPVDLRATAGAGAPATAATATKTSAFDSQSFLSALAVDVTLFAPDDLVLRGSRLRPDKDSWSLGDLNVTVGGELQATRAAGGEPQLRGDIVAIRGSYSFEGRRFEIQRGGRIRFRGEVPADPTFDIRGVRAIDGIEARVDVRGSLSAPSLQLGSNVPLDDADVLSMIIFNRPVNQLGDTQRADLVGAAASVAGGYVTSPLAQRLSRALDLDLLEVETVSFGQNVAPRVRVGQRLTSRLFVQLSQQFGAQSLSELTAEYQLAKFLRLQASTAQGPGSRAQRSLLQRAERAGLDLLFFFNY